MSRSQNENERLEPYCQDIASSKEKFGEMEPAQIFKQMNEATGLSVFTMSANRRLDLGKECRGLVDKKGKCSHYAEKRAAGPVKDNDSSHRCRLEFRS